MSEEKKQHDELEELSLLLDELNAGRRPECADPETAELLAVADLIKKSSGPVCPPRHILNQTVDRALAGIEAGNKKPSRAWWYSGALGTAAAVILVFGLNMLPSWQQQVPVAPPPSALSVNQDTPQPKPESAPPLAPPSTPAVPADKPTTADSAPADTRQQTPASEQKQDKGIPQTPPADLQKPAATAREKAVVMAEAQPTTQAKSLYLPPPALPDASAITPLGIPGQKPDLLIIDRDNSTVHQIYYKGTPREVSITQRLRPQDTVNSKAKSQPPGMMQAPNIDPDDAIIVQVTIANQEVTIKGLQSKQELLKLAESLTPGNGPQ